MAGRHGWDKVKAERRSAAEAEAVRREAERDVAGVTLAQLRKDAGLTQAKLAELLKVQQSEVAQLEKRPGIRISTLQDVARALGGTIGIYFFKGHDTVRKLLIGEEAAEVQGKRSAPAATATKASARKRAPKAGR